MNSNLFPRDLMEDVFDMVRKDGKIYIVFKHEDDQSVNKAKEFFGEDNVEFLDFFDMVQKNMLKDFFDAPSVIDDETFGTRLGMKEVTELFYDLSDLKQSDKMLFNYALSGRRGKSGLVQESGGSRLGRSVVSVPSEKEGEVETFIRSWHVKYTKRKFLELEEDEENGN